MISPAPPHNFGVTVVIGIGEASGDPTQAGSVSILWHAAGPPPTLQPVEHLNNWSEQHRIQLDAKLPAALE
jgi:hypothetical protein